MSAFDPIETHRPSNHHPRCPCADCDAEARGEEPGNPIRGLVFALPLSIMGWLGIALVLHFLRFV